jgi:tRNA (guanine37-N1)-methyltransferase
MNAWTAHVLTLFPEMFPGSLGHSIAGKALEQGLWALETVDIRDFAGDKHRTVDDAPFGGGPGMVMRPDVVDRALAATDGGDAPVIYLTPRGEPLDQELVQSLAMGSGVVLLCGRFEGIDQRVIDLHEPREVSIGDFVLSGGEPAALALIDACVRLLPSVLGDKRSLEEESFENGLLEYPHYTRPSEWRDITVPDVLLSGHHERIQMWRTEQAKQLTKERRPDMWSRHLDTNS